MLHRAFGFASRSTIFLVNAEQNNYGYYSWDSATASSADRLSWSYTKGGYRAGSIYPGQHNNVYKKIIFYKRCTDNSEEYIPPRPSSLSRCIASNTVVHNWNLNYLTDDGWQSCYNEPYSDYTSITELITQCPTGQDHYLFVGALSTSKSQYALIGAYAPSRVLTEFTTSTSSAKLPNQYENTSYNVYWYNYLPGSGNVKAFGFSSNDTITLTSQYLNNYGHYSWDSSTIGSADRLSWSYTKGGYRVGNVNPGYGNTIYRKIIYWKHCPPTQSPTMAPTTGATSQPPTLSPSLAPTDSPSGAPTYSPYQMILVPGSYYCVEIGNVDPGYLIAIENIDKNECVFQCQLGYPDTCVMVNFVESLNAQFVDTCYIFTEQCTAVDDPLGLGTVAVKSYKDECLNYPDNFVDRGNNNCLEYFENQLCEDGNVTNLTTMNDVDALKNLATQLSALDACCECGGGIDSFDEVTIAFADSTSNQGINPFRKQNAQCSFNFNPSDGTWRSFNNMDLWYLCTQLSPMLDCHVFIAKDYSGNVNFINCNFDTYEPLTDDLVFMFILSVNADTSTIDAYINMQWFNLTASLLKSTPTEMTYDQCVTQLSANPTNNYHAALSCFVQTDSPTQQPTNIPTHTPTVYPTKYPTIHPKIIRHFLQQAYQLNLQQLLQQHRHHHLPQLQTQQNPLW